MDTRENGNVDYIARGLALRPQLGLTVNAFDSLSLAQQVAVASGTVNNDRIAATDLTQRLVRGMALAAIQGKVFNMPDGLYNVVPIDQFLSEAGNCLRCFPIISNLKISGGASTHIRIIDGVSSDLSPIPMCMFGTNQVVSNIAWYNMRLDMNGQNNKISPNRNNTALPHNGYNLFNQAHIYISGTVNGVAARVDHMRTSDNLFENTPGVSCIVLMQSNTPNVQMGTDWVSRNDRFHNNGLDTVDHSSVFAWHNNIRAYGPRFENDVQFANTGPGALVAWEVHGSDQVIDGIYVRNYFQGFWGGENKTSDCVGTRILNARLENIKAVGYQPFADTGGFSNRDVVIDNMSVIFDTAAHPGYPLKAGVAMVGPQARGEILINNLYVEAPAGMQAASTAITIASALNPNQLSSDITSVNTRCRGTTFRHFIRNNAVNGLGDIKIVGGRGMNLTPAGAFNVAADISLDASTKKPDNTPNPVHSLTLDRQTAIDERTPAVCDYGGYLDGIVTNYILYSGVYQNMKTGGLTEASSFAPTNRFGS